MTYLTCQNLDTATRWASGLADLVGYAPTGVDLAFVLGRSACSAEAYSLALLDAQGGPPTLPSRVSPVSSSERVSVAHSAKASTWRAWRDLGVPG